jgi:hypothetical protein
VLVTDIPCLGGATAAKSGSGGPLGALTRVIQGGAAGKEDELAIKVRCLFGLAGDALLAWKPPAGITTTMSVRTRAACLRGSSLLALHSGMVTGLDN